MACKRQPIINTRSPSMFRMKSASLHLLLLSFLSLIGIASSLIIDTSLDSSRRRLPSVSRGGGGDWGSSSCISSSSTTTTNLHASSLDDDFMRTQKPSNEAEFQEIRRSVMAFLSENNYEGAKETIRGMVEYVQEAFPVSDSGKLDDKQPLCEVVDEAFQTYFNSAFAAPYRGKAARIRIRSGMEVLQMQLSSRTLESPYNAIPKRTLLGALRALTGVNEVKHVDSIDGILSNTDAAYRVLQRLVTGVGVRSVDDSSNATTQLLHEKDFNMVLNAYSNVGRMDMAHRIMALQERTPNAPGLSPVAYSILLKGYGKLGDLNNIDMLLTNAEASGVEPDQIMLNSLIDAYINCDELEKAREIFDYMRNPRHAGKFISAYETLFAGKGCPPPNKRTYNIFLKGLANRGLLQEAMDISKEMEAMGLWDHVTTNTLVLVAVKSNAFLAVDQILEDYTERNPKTRSGHHPNAEAYTTAIDGYAKAGNLQKALELLKLMKDRGVQPNEYQYTSLIGGLARSKKIDQAKKMMVFMKTTGLRVGAVTYNSFISGLVHKDPLIDAEEFDGYVDEAIRLLREMMRDGIRPNTVTVSVIVDAFGNCDRPRLAEAISLVERLETDGIVVANNTRITTALLQVFGAAGDLDGALQTFRKIKKPDVAAINSLLDACMRCDNEKVARETFDYYYRGSKPRQRPDVIAFSIMIASLVKKNYFEASKAAIKLYEEMKYERRLKPDKALVDIILKSMIENSKSGGLHAKEVRFVAGALRDAEKLEWGEGQLERRKLAIQIVMTGRTADKNAWDEEAGLYGLLEVEQVESEDDLFKRHGWNKVDSGFRLWGAENVEIEARGQRRDNFLESKGWNSVDSGFRII